MYVTVRVHIYVRECEELRRVLKVKATRAQMKMLLYLQRGAGDAEERNKRGRRKATPKRSNKRNKPKMDLFGV